MKILSVVHPDFDLEVLGSITEEQYREISLDVENNPDFRKSVLELIDE